MAKNEPPNPPTEVLNSQQAANVIGMSTRFVQEHAQELGAISIGGTDERAGRLKFTHQGLNKFLKRKSGRRAERKVA